MAFNSNAVTDLSRYNFTSRFATN